MNRFCIVFLLALAPSAGLAESGPAQAIPWTVLDLPSGDRVDLAIPDSSFSHWIVGIKITPGEKDRIEVADAAFQNARRGLVTAASLRTLPVTAHPPALVSVGNSSVTIGGGGQTLVVYLGLSNPRTVNITAGNGAPISLPVNRSVAIADGVVKQASLTADFQLIMIAAAGFQANSAAPVFSHSGVNTVIDPEYLRSHLARYVAFQPVDAGDRVSMLLVRLEIGPDGAVQNVSCGNSETPRIASACDIATATLKQWAFTPFVVNGQASPVRANFPILIGAGGAMASTISPGFSAQR